MAEVTISAKAASIVKYEVQVEKDKDQKIVDGIEKEKAVAEGKWKAVQPALDEVKLH